MAQAAKILSPALTPKALVPVREPAASAAVPFFPPDFSRIADYDPDIFSPEVGAVIMPGHTTKFDSLAEVLHNPAVPILAFTPALYQEINYLTAAIDTEWAIFLTLKRLSPAEPHFLAYDWFMPLQTAHSGGVSVDAEDARRYYQALKEHPYFKDHGLHRHLCHLHSHVDMQVFFSDTDDVQQLSREDLGFLDDFRFYAVVNQKQHIMLSFVNYRPVLFRAEAVPALLFSRPEYVGALTAERKKEIDARVRALVKESSGFSVPGPAFPSRPRRKRRPDIPAASRAGAQAEAGAGSQEQKERPRPESIVALVDYLGEQVEKHSLGKPHEAPEKIDNNALNPSSFGLKRVSIPLCKALGLPEAQAENLESFLAASMSPVLLIRETSYWADSLHGFFTVLADEYEEARDGKAMDDEEEVEFLDAYEAYVPLSRNTVMALRSPEALRTPELYDSIIIELTEWQLDRVDEARGSHAEEW